MVVNQRWPHLLTHLDLQMATNIRHFRNWLSRASVKRCMNLHLLPPVPQDILPKPILQAERREKGKRMQHIHSTLGENAAGLSNERTSIIRVRALFFPLLHHVRVCCFACSAKISENVPEFPDRRPPEVARKNSSFNSSNRSAQVSLSEREGGREGGKSVFLHRAPDGIDCFCADRKNRSCFSCFLVHMTKEQEVPRSEVFHCLKLMVF